jgi:hypothetical protein
MRSTKEIEQEILRLQKELEEARNARPVEPDADPAVIFFQKTFSKNGSRVKQVYSYTAVKGGDMWSITGNSPGRNPNPKTWDDLVDFICQGEKDTPQVWLASELTPLDFEKG